MILVMMIYQIGSAEDKNFLDLLLRVWQHNQW